MIIHLMIRGYVRSQCQFEDRIEIDTDELEALLPGLAQKHAKALAAHQLHMIEIEFLDEPDPNQRFFRFGTDPAGMFLPIEVDLKRKPS